MNYSLVVQLSEGLGLWKRGLVLKILQTVGLGAWRICIALVINMFVSPGHGTGRVYLVALCLVGLLMLQLSLTHTVNYVAFGSKSTVLYSGTVVGLQCGTDRLDSMAFASAVKVPAKCLIPCAGPGAPAGSRCLFGLRGA